MHAKSLIYTRFLLLLKDHLRRVKERIRYMLLFLSPHTFFPTPTFVARSIPKIPFDHDPKEIG
jgi:hypothetical protein